MTKEPVKHTPVRAFRIPDDLYEAAKATARERGETITWVVRRALEDYVRPTGREPK